MYLPVKLPMHEQCHQVTNASSVVGEAPPSNADEDVAFGAGSVKWKYYSREHEGSCLKVTRQQPDAGVISRFPPMSAVETWMQAYMKVTR